MKKTHILIALAALLTAACGKAPKDGKKPETANPHMTLPGDSTRYGLACDGCTDSILVLLPFSGENPDTFDIISASQQREVFGRPKIGDELAVILSPDDSMEAVKVINLERLRGTWAYMVTPTLRRMDQMSPKMQQRMLQNMPDSLRQRWMKPREYSLRLKRDHSALAMGNMRRPATSDATSPVTYPAIKRYTEWHIWNGRIILKADTIAGFTQEGEEPECDTVDIVMLRRDTLVFRFRDHVQGYYRKK